jgi:hypothetical protein
MISKNTKTLLVKQFVRARSDKERASFLASDTTLLCNGMVYTKQKDPKLQVLGERIITSVLKSHEVGERRTSNFVRSVKYTNFADVKKFMLRLQPYKEMKRWIEEIN